MTDPWDRLRPALDELAPLLRRAVDLDAAGPVRVRARAGTVSALVRLPFAVLAARTVSASSVPDGGISVAEGEVADVDITVVSADLLAWLDAPGSSAVAPPGRRDELWRAAAPPDRGWQRLDSVPDSVVRDLVRTGALVLKEAADREGVPGAQPRAEVAEALLDSIVLTVTADDHSREAAVSLRSLSALTRLGFVPRGSSIHVDRAGRWIRLAAGYGSVYAEEPGGLAISSL